MRFDHVYEVDPGAHDRHTPQQDIPAWDTLRIVDSRWEHRVDARPLRGQRPLGRGAPGGNRG